MLRKCITIGPPSGSHHAYQRSFLQDASVRVLHFARRRPRHRSDGGFVCRRAEGQLQEGVGEGVCKVRSPFPKCDQTKGRKGFADDLVRYTLAKPGSQRNQHGRNGLRTAAPATAVMA